MAQWKSILEMSHDEVASVARVVDERILPGATIDDLPDTQAVRLIADTAASSETFTESLERMMEAAADPSAKKEKPKRESKKTSTVEILPPVTLSNWREGDRSVLGKVINSPKSLLHGYKYIYPGKRLPAMAKGVPRLSSLVKNEHLFVVEKRDGENKQSLQFVILREGDDAVKAPSLFLKQIRAKGVIVRQKSGRRSLSFTNRYVLPEQAGNVVVPYMSDIDWEKDVERQHNEMLKRKREKFEKESLSETPDNVSCGGDDDTAESLSDGEDGEVAAAMKVAQMLEADGDATDELALLSNADILLDQGVVMDKDSEAALTFFREGERALHDKTVETELRKKRDAGVGDPPLFPRSGPSAVESKEEAEERLKQERLAKRREREAIKRKAKREAALAAAPKSADDASAAPRILPVEKRRKKGTPVPMSWTQFNAQHERTPTKRPPREWENDWRYWVRTVKPWVEKSNAESAPTQPPSLFAPYPDLPEDPKAATNLRGQKNSDYARDRRLMHRAVINVLLPMVYDLGVDPAKVEKETGVPLPWTCRKRVRAEEEEEDDSPEDLW